MSDDPARSPSPSRALLLLALALLLLSALIVAYSLGARSGVESLTLPETPPPEPLAAREVAPGFSLPSLRGRERISLAEFRGQVVVLNFFASWCGPCALEAADLERTWQASRDRGVIFLGVAIQDQPDDARAFLQRHGITYPAVIDTTGEVMQAYRVTAIPTTYFLDPEGRITGRHAGIFVGDEGVARLMERIARAREGSR
jgi:cytochrome c biogenesis protein CcmG/thiol:disulfide interchange protein DsbE